MILYGVVAISLLTQTPAPEILAETVRLERARLELAETFSGAKGLSRHKDLAILTFGTKQAGLFLPRGGAPRVLMFGDFECQLIADFVLSRGHVLCVAPWPEDSRPALWLAREGWSPRQPGDEPIEVEEERARRSSNAEWLPVSVPPELEPLLTFFDYLEAVGHFSRPR